MSFLSAQLGELGIAWLLAAAGMAVALLLMRADRRAWFRWPVYSTMAMASGVMLWNFLRKHVFPAEWLADPSGALYWSALAVYPLLGIMLGLLLARISRPRRVVNEGDADERP